MFARIVGGCSTPGQATITIRKDHNERKDEERDEIGYFLISKLKGEFGTRHFYANFTSANTAN